MSIAGADNSAGGKTIEEKEKYYRTKKLPKTQEESVKCRTDWDNHAYKKQNTRIIHVNEAAPGNRMDLVQIQNFLVEGIKAEQLITEGPALTDLVFKLGLVQYVSMMRFNLRIRWVFSRFGMMSMQFFCCKLEY